MEKIKYITIYSRDFEKKKKHNIFQSAKNIISLFYLIIFSHHINLFYASINLISFHFAILLLVVKFKI